ncbi:MAG TPA: hypothetical protein VGQ27_11635 [Steroidobacteraceae bacterium]|jgi:hypothetical protein|nr:hypothetical protein [Steroidobacteraceae bacterium]
MIRIAIVFLFAGTFGALLGGGLTDHFLRGGDVMVAANDSLPSSAPIAWQAGSTLFQASLKAPRHLAMVGTHKNSHRASIGLLPVSIEDGLYDDITVAPRSHKLMISALHVSARMAVSGG